MNRIKNLFMIAILIFSFSSIFASEIHDNNKIVVDYDTGKKLPLYNDSIKDKVKYAKSEKITKQNDTYYNKYGGVRRKNIDKANIKIKDKLIYVKNYNKSDDDFEVSMYVGTDNVKYAIKHHNTSQDYNYISQFGNHIGDVVSNDGYINYNTSMFSAQIATIPSYYEEGEFLEYEGEYYSGYLTEYGIQLEDYFQGVKKVWICDIDGCGSSQTLSPDTEYEGTINLQRLNAEYFFATDSINDYSDQYLEIYFDYFERSAYESRSFSAWNDKIELQIQGDDNKYYYTNFYLTYFYPDEPVRYGQSQADTWDQDINELSENTGFENKGFSSTLVELEDDENFGFKINEHFLNYDTWGFRLRDSVGDPMDSAELFRYMDGCTTYTGSEIDIQICSDNYKADMLYINPKGVPFDGSVELYACNNEYDSCATEKSYEFDLVVAGDELPPSLDTSLDDISIGYYDYDSLDINDYFSAYTSFEVNINNDECIRTLEKDEGLSTTCTVNGVSYAIYPSGILTFESTNIENIDTDITITATNDYGSVSDSLLLNVQDISSTLANDIAAYWSFDDDDIDGNTIYDLTPNDNDGNNNGATCGVAGQINESCDFDGSNDYINTPITNLGDEFSVSLWINADNLANYPIGNTDQKENGEFFIRHVGTNNIQWNMHGISQNAVTGTGTISTGTWHHLVLTYDGSNMRGYIDSVLDIDPTSISGWDGIDNTPIQISRNLRDSSFWNGRIDEPSIWNRALSQEEVTELYDRQKNNLIGAQYDFSVEDDGIPPGINQSFDDITLLPEESVTYDMNDYFYGYNTIELKYYDAEFDEWFSIELNTSQEEVSNSLGGLDISLNTGSDDENYTTIFATISGNSLPYDDFVYITASNEFGSTSEESFNVFVDYTSPENVPPEYYEEFENVGLQYNSVENINLNDHYLYYDYINVTVDGTSIQVYLNGSNDYDEIVTSNFNISLENIGTYIALTLLSYSSDDTQDIGVIACNDYGCDVMRTFTLSISESGEAVVDVPSWFPDPPEEEKLYWAISIMVIFIVGIALIGATSSGIDSGLIFFGIIGIFALFLIFSIIGWIPIWILILFIITIILFVAYFIRNVVTGRY